MLFYQFAKTYANDTAWLKIGEGYFRDYTEANCAFLGIRDDFAFSRPMAIFNVEEIEDD